MTLVMQDEGQVHEAFYAGTYVYAGRGQHRDCLIVSLKLKNACCRSHQVETQNTQFWARSFKVAMKISTANCKEQRGDFHMLKDFRSQLSDGLAAQFPIPLAHFETGLVCNQPKSVLICEAKGDTGTSLGNTLKEIREDQNRIATREVLVLVVRATLWAFQLQK